MEFNLLYVTFSSESEANSLARELLEANLIFCANRLQPITSVYKWKDKIEESIEHVQIFKVLATNVAEASDYISNKHSYDAPAIVKIDASSLNPNYSEWAQNH